MGNPWTRPCCVAVFDQKGVKRHRPGTLPTKVLDAAPKPSTKIPAYKHLFRSLPNDKGPNHQRPSPSLPWNPRLPHHIPLIHNEEHKEGRRSNANMVTPQHHPLSHLERLLDLPRRVLRRRAHDAVLLRHAHHPPARLAHEPAEPGVRRRRLARERGHARVEERLVARGVDAAYVGDDARGLVVLADEPRGELLEIVDGEVA